MRADDDLADVLLVGASLPANSPAEALLKAMSSSRYSYSANFADMLRRVEKGESLTNVLCHCAKGNDRMFSLACRMISNSYERGFPLSEALSSMSRVARQYNMLYQKRQSELFMQKASIAISVVLVPLLISIVQGISRKASFGGAVDDSVFMAYFIANSLVYSHAFSRLEDKNMLFYIVIFVFASFLSYYIGGVMI